MFDTKPLTRRYDETLVHETGASTEIRASTRMRALGAYATALIALLFIFSMSARAAESQPEQSSVTAIVGALRRQDFDGALRLSGSALKQAPRDQRLWTLRGMAFAGKGSQAEALSAFQHALKLGPTYLPALEGAAEIEYSREDPAAKQLLEQILVQRPDDAMTHAMLGYLEYREKDCALAARHFEASMPVLANQPNGLGAYGACLVVLDRYDAAVSLFQRALALAPGNVKLRLNLAVAQWRANHPEDALSTLQPTLSNPPPDINAALLAADIHESMNDTPKAVELLRSAILADPTNVDAYVAFASLSADHASMQVGIDMLNAGLTQLPKESRLYLARGVLLAQIGKTQEALADFETANRLSPGVSFAGVAEGLAQSQEHRTNVALNSFQTSAKAHPDDALTHYLLAEALSQQGKGQGTPEYREAVAAAQRAALLDPHMVAAHDLLATIYLQSGRPDLAAKESRAALAVDSKDQQAVYHLILALRRTDEKDQIPDLLRRLATLRAAEQTEGGHKRRYKLEEMPSVPLGRE
jgi:tetratricopeptide (TPR) repeat protein